MNSRLNKSQKKFKVYHNKNPQIHDKKKKNFKAARHIIYRKTKTKMTARDFSGSTVVKNPPANAGDTGSIPGLGRSHMLWSNQAHVPQPLSLRSTAREPQLLRPGATTTETCVPRAHAPQIGRASCRERV